MYAKALHMRLFCRLGVTGDHNGIRGDHASIYKRD